MNLMQALILGIVQGLTEVLPVSSSAHLILIPRLLNWAESGLTFDVALHVGTLIALCLYFRNDIADMTRNFFRGLLERNFRSVERRLPLYIIAGSIPAALVGKTLEEPIENLFRSNPALIALFLIVFGIVLGIADKWGAQKKELAGITLQTALIIGLAQCLALLPGVSRSGITITAALILGFRRETATRFSFLLSLPIVAGAGFLKLGHLAKHGVPQDEAILLLVGIVTSAVFGYLSVAFLLRFVQRHTIQPFVWYRILAGGAVLSLIYWR